MQTGEYMARVFALVGTMLVLAVACIMTHAASAQVMPSEPPSEGRVFSFTCGELPEGAAFDVTPFSDSRLDLELARTFAAELRKLEHQVTSGERFEMTLESEVGRGVIEAPSRSLGRLKVKNRGVEVRFNIWSSRKDSLLAGRRRKGEARETTYLAVTATLRDRKTGKALWTGETIGELRGATPLNVGQALMPPLAEAFHCSLNLDGVHERDQ